MSFHVIREHSHDFKSVVTLQNCMAILRDVLGSCQTSSGDENQFLFVNADKFTDIEVSCISGIMHRGQISRVACHTVCLSVYPQSHLYTGEHCVISCMEMLYTYCTLPCPICCKSILRL